MLDPNRILNGIETHRDIERPGAATVAIASATNGSRNRTVYDIRVKRYPGIRRRNSEVLPMAFSPRS